MSKCNHEAAAGDSKKFSSRLQDRRIRCTFSLFAKSIVGNVPSTESRRGERFLFSARIPETNASASCLRANFHQCALSPSLCRLTRAVANWLRLSFRQRQSVHSETSILVDDFFCYSRNASITLNAHATNVRFLLLAYFCNLQTRNSLQKVLIPYVCVIVYLCDGIVFDQKAHKKRSRSAASERFSYGICPTAKQIIEIKNPLEG